jgi:hypothetical protein
MVTFTYAITGCFLIESLCSSSSIVSQSALPLVSGKHIANSPQHPITNPNTTYGENPSPLPAATSIGENTPPSTSACLTIDIAEFRTRVGNSSIVNINNILVAVQALKKDTNSTPICNLFHSPPSNHT